MTAVRRLGWIAALALAVGMVCAVVGAARIPGGGHGAYFTTTTGHPPNVVLFTKHIDRADTARWWLRVAAIVAALSAAALLGSLRRSRARVPLAVVGIATIVVALVGLNAGLPYLSYHVVNSPDGMVFPRRPLPGRDWLEVARAALSIGWIAVVAMVALSARRGPRREVAAGELY